MTKAMTKKQTLNMLIIMWNDAKADYFKDVEYTPEIWIAFGRLLSLQSVAFRLDLKLPETVEMLMLMKARRSKNIKTGAEPNESEGQITGHM